MWRVCILYVRSSRWHIAALSGLSGFSRYNSGASLSSGLGLIDTLFPPRQRGKDSPSLYWETLPYTLVPRYLPPTSRLWEFIFIHLLRYSVYFPPFGLYLPARNERYHSEMNAVDVLRNHTPRQRFRKTPCKAFSNATPLQMSACCLISSRMGKRMPRIFYGARQCIRYCINSTRAILFINWTRQEKIAKASGNTSIWKRIKYSYWYFWGWCLAGKSVSKCSWKDVISAMRCLFLPLPLH